MTNIVSFLEKADQYSLVLFDELCSGTDPTEGAALAISILSYLHDRGIRTMATIITVSSKYLRSLPPVSRMQAANSM